MLQDCGAEAAWLRGEMRFGQRFNDKPFMGAVSVDKTSSLRKFNLSSPM
jgi:hypothetical protein